MSAIASARDDVYSRRRVSLGACSCLGGANLEGDVSATYARVTPNLPCSNPNASRTNERPVQLTQTDGHLIWTDGHVDNPAYVQLKKKDQVLNSVNFVIP